MEVQIGDIIARKYTINKCIGSGKFGCVYKGLNTKTNEPVAMKFENKETIYKLLKRETTILNYLYEHGCRNTPCVYWYGLYTHFTCLVMPFYECSLYEYSKIKEITDHQLDTMMIQCIRIIESIHINIVIHRDIKPQNFMLKNGELFLIDFGLATFYINEYKIHVPNVMGEHVTGTPRFISQHIHDGCTPSRRDDLISLGYIYIYMYANELPWDSVPTDITISSHTNEIHIMHSKNIQRKELKSIDNIIDVCRRINSRIENFFRFCNSYDYEKEPMYNSLCSLFA